MILTKVKSSSKKYPCTKCPKKFYREMFLSMHYNLRHKPMSIQQFLKKLSDTPRLWSLNAAGRIVYSDDMGCPLSAVAGLLFDGQPESEAFDYESAKRLGISASNAAKIIRASDSLTTGGGTFKTKNLGWLRVALLDACGITQEYEED